MSLKVCQIVPAGKVGFVLMRKRKIMSIATDGP